MLDIFFIIIKAIPSAFHYGISLLANFLTHGFPLLKRDIFRYNKTIAVFVVNCFHDSSTVSECAGDICVCAKRILRGFRWMGVNVVTAFQFSTKIRTVNPSGIVVGHIMNFSTLGDDQHMLNIGFGIASTKRIFKCFNLLCISHIDFPQNFVNDLSVLPGETTAASLTWRRRNFLLLRRPRRLTSLTPAKLRHAGAGAVYSAAGGLGKLRKALAGGFQAHSTVGGVHPGCRLGEIPLLPAVSEWR